MSFSNECHPIPNFLLCNTRCPHKPKKSIIETITVVEENDLDYPVTYKGLESALSNNLIKTMEALQSSLKSTTKLANNTLAIVTKLEKEVAVLKE